MMAKDHIISVSEADFEYQVIEFSKNIPVVVDFWAEWCAPCRTLEPILERLTELASGAFRLAKVNVDENPNLALHYNVRSIPNIKAFRDGQVVAELTGALPEARIREFLTTLAPSEHDLLLDKAFGLLDMRQIPKAEENFRKFLEKSPGHPAGSLGLIRSLMLQGKVHEAAPMLRTFPASKEYNSAEILNQLFLALRRLDTGHAYSDDPLEAAYLNALRLVLRGNFEAAMDGMLDVLRQDKTFMNGELRKVMLGIFEMLGSENPLTRQYRSELAMVLF
jgi:putative thioredoxin